MSLCPGLEKSMRSCCWGCSEHEAELYGTDTTTETSQWLLCMLRRRQELLAAGLSAGGAGVASSQADLCAVWATGDAFLST